MLRKKVIFNDNLTDYDTLGNWDENGGDATYTSDNDYLTVYKTNSDNPAGGNYIDLTTPFDKIYDFTIKIDFKIIQKSADSDMAIVRLIDGSTTRGILKVNLTTPDIKFYDEETGPEVQIGSDYTLVQNRWFRAKMIFSYNQQTSSTGKISAHIKDLSDPDNDWEYIGTNSTQGGGIDDIRIGHPEASAETFQYQFKNLIIYQTEEFP